MDFLLQVGQWLANPVHWQGPGGIPTRLGEHIAMSVAATLAGASVALPIGILLGHWGRFGGLAVNISNVGRAIPSFAILVIALQLFHIGATPAFVALVLLAIPPMVIPMPSSTIFDRRFPTGFLAASSWVEQGHR